MQIADLLAVHAIRRSRSRSNRMNLAIRRAQPSESRALSAWIKERHYLRSTPPGYVVALEVVNGKDRIGAMLLGRPASKALAQDGRVLELTRMYLIDEAPANSESRALALMRRFVRTWLPSVRLLIAYSDPSVGHNGTIYEADGWGPFGSTSKKSGYGWKNRPNRSNDPVTPKQRWVRTP
jgi:hypothetical protein